MLLFHCFRFIVLVIMLCIFLYVLPMWHNNNEETFKDSDKLVQSTFKVLVSLKDITGFEKYKTIKDLQGPMQSCIVQ